MDPWRRPFSRPESGPKNGTAHCVAFACNPLRCRCEFRGPLAICSHWVSALTAIRTFLACILAGVAFGCEFTLFLLLALLRRWLLPCCAVCCQQLEPRRSSCAVRSRHVLSHARMARCYVCVLGLPCLLRLVDPSCCPGVLFACVNSAFPSLFLWWTQVSYSVPLCHLLHGGVISL